MSKLDDLSEALKAGSKMNRLQDAVRRLKAATKKMKDGAASREWPKCPHCQKDVQILVHVFWGARNPKTYYWECERMTCRARGPLKPTEAEAKQSARGR